MEGERDFRKTAVEKRARGTWREMWRRRRRKREREREYVTVDGAMRKRGRA